MGSPISPLVTNCYMEQFNKLAISTALTPHHRGYDMWMTHSPYLMNTTWKSSLNISTALIHIKFTIEPKKADLCWACCKKLTYFEVKFVETYNVSTGHLQIEMLYVSTVCFKISEFLITTISWSHEEYIHYFGTTIRCRVTRKLGQIYKSHNIHMYHKPANTLPSMVEQNTERTPMWNHLQHYM